MVVVTEIPMGYIAGDFTYAPPMKPKRICVDLDGVVCEYNFPRIVKDYLGVDLSAQMLFAYDLADVLGVAPAMINTMFKKQVHGEPSFIDGAVETLKDWQSRDYRIDIYTGRLRYMSLADLLSWLRTWRIPFTSVKVGPPGESHYGYHIDDSPGKLMTTDSEVKLLFNQPWNERCLNITGQLTRVGGWDEIRRIIDG